jgi:Rrf2 family protein
MKISEGVEWGVHCALLLAALEPGATLPGKALAQYHDISETYLAKHLQAMVNAGIIESISGPKGGYRLARSPENITMLDIIDAIEGREPAFHCTEIRQRGPTALEPEAYRLPCAIHATMLRADNAWRAVLRGQTLSNLQAQMMQHADPRGIAKATAWFSDHAR